ncbi:hypothetical protein JCM12298_29090 [Desulfothermus naphthae]
MQYDIASKVILSHCRKAVLQELCGLRVREDGVTGTDNRMEEIFATEDTGDKMSSLAGRRA